MNMDKYAHNKNCLKVTVGYHIKYLDIHLCNSENKYTFKFQKFVVTHILNY